MPLMPESVRLEMLERTLCFEAAEKARYTLFYGDPALAAPHYDYATLFTAKTDATQTVAGPEQRNPEYQSRPDERPFTEKHPALLWAALIVVIALLEELRCNPQNRRRRRHSRNSLRSVVARDSSASPGHWIVQLLSRELRSHHQESRSFACAISFPGTYRLASQAHAISGLATSPWLAMVGFGAGPSPFRLRIVLPAARGW